MLGFLAFYNLGQPQFRDGRRGQPTFVHYLDLRQYYPTAKYFKEIGYRDVYVADMAAYREEKDANLDAINRLPMRDLHTLRMSTVGDKEEEVRGGARPLFPRALGGLQARRPLLPGGDGHAPTGWTRCTTWGATPPRSG